MAYPERAAPADDTELKRKLILRVLFAGLMIVLLLGVLAFLDYLGSRPDDPPQPSGPVFSSPVPVPKKEVTQPLKPAEPVVSTPAPAPAEPAKEAATVAAPPPPVVQASPAPPEPPAIAAQPVLPRTESRVAASPPPNARVVSRSASPAAPAEGTTAVTSAPPPAPVVQEKPPAAVAPAPVERMPPAPPRLLSGYAVQAGVFADARHAEELRAKLTLSGIPSTLEARVQVGPFRTREEAMAAQEKLKSLGIDGVLLPPKGARR